MDFVVWNEMAVKKEPGLGMETCKTNSESENNVLSYELKTEKKDKFLSNSGLDDVSYNVKTVKPEPQQNESSYWLDINLNSNLDLIEGDIIPNEDRYAMRYKSKRWTDNIVYYGFRKSDPLEGSCITRIKEALADLTAKTGNCITFIHDPNGYHVNRLDIYKGSGCSSAIGMVGGAQRLSIGKGCCYRFVIQHEIFHALGIWHEHNRFDRDSYLNIYWENILPDLKYAFEKKSLETGDPLGESFDYDSIMLYRSSAFTKNGRPTLLKKNGDTIFDNRELSPVDIRKIKKFYECS